MKIANKILKKPILAGFHCKECKHWVRFTNVKHVKRHMRLKHQQRPGKCSICKKTVVDLPAHLKKRNRAYAYECIKCHKLFINASRLQRHAANKIQDCSSKHLCSICNGLFFHFCLLYQHMSECHLFTVATHQCVFCRHTYVTNKKLTTHVRKIHKNITHVSEIPFIDEEDVLSVKLAVNDDSNVDLIDFHNNSVGVKGKVVGRGKTKFQLKLRTSGKRWRNKQRQIRNVENSNDIMKKPILVGFHCKECKKWVRFTNMKYFKRHMRLEHQQRPEKCSICKKTVKNLPAHLKKHTRTYTHECEKCHKLFINASELRQHTKQPQDCSPKFLCSICNCLFLHFRQIYQHMAECHLFTVDKYQCVFCRRTYVTRHKLTGHITRIHKNVNNGSKIPLYLYRRKERQTNNDKHAKQTVQCP